MRTEPRLGENSLHALLEPAARAVAAHDDAVAATVRAADRQQAAALALRDTMVAVRAAADAVAAQVAELAGVARELPDRARGSGARLAAVETSLRAVAGSIAGGVTATGRLDAGWLGVERAVDGIARSARRARVLAVNAAIEAAHADAAASGFAIVAARMRGLSGSTLDAARDVAGIAGAARGSAATVLAASQVAEIACAAVAGPLAAAARDFADASARVTAFAEGIARVAAAAEEQHAVNGRIAGSVERLAGLALRVGAGARESAHGIGEGVAAARAALAASDGEAALRAAVRGLETSALGAARAAVAWSAVDAAVDELGTELARVTVAVEAAALAAEALDGAAAGIAASLAHLDGTVRAGFEAFERAVSEVAGAKRQAVEVHGGIVAMAAATARAGEIVTAVADISAESELLALNAAIEAARAGERGLGFTVIAEEIGRLASATRAATDGVGETIEDLHARSGRLERASEVGGAQMDDVVREAHAGRAALDALRTTIATSAERARAIARAAADLAAGSRAILAETGVAREALAGLGRAEREAARLALSDLLGAAHQAVAELDLDLPVPRLHGLIDGLAAEVEAVYAQAAAAGRIGRAAAFDTAYVELRGDEVAHLARFADVQGAPRDGFTPPKYRTSYDAAIDLAITALFDRTMREHPELASLGAFDLNGFAVALGTNVSATDDWARNRAKRIFEDPIMLRCARVGLGDGAAGSGLRRDRAAFARDGYALRREAARPWSAFAYVQSGTNDVFVNIAAAVYLGEERVGTVALIVDAARIA